LALYGAESQTSSKTLPDGSLLLKEMFKMNVWGIKGMKIGM
jgi:hypothetical protein